MSIIGTSDFSHFETLAEFHIRESERSKRTFTIEASNSLAS